MTEPEDQARVEGKLPKIVEKAKRKWPAVVELFRSNQMKYGIVAALIVGLVAGLLASCVS